MTDERNFAGFDDVKRNTSFNGKNRCLMVDWFRQKVPERRCCTGYKWDLSDLWDVCDFGYYPETV